MTLKYFGADLPYSFRNADLRFLSLIGQQYTVPGHQIVPGSLLKKQIYPAGMIKGLGGYMGDCAWQLHLSQPVAMIKGAIANAGHPLRYNHLLQTASGEGKLSDLLQAFRQRQTPQILITIVSPICQYTAVHQCVFHSSLSLFRGVFPHGLSLPAFRHRTSPA